MFDGLKVFDELFVFEMLEEVKYGLASIQFFLAADVFKTAFEEEVVEGDSRSELRVLFDFDDSAEDVIFKLDIHLGVVLVGNVEKLGVEGHELPFETGDLPERRFAGKLNDGGKFAVDGGLGYFLSGQERGKNFKGIAVVAFELLAIIGHVELGLEEHELFDAVKNGGELYFAGLGFGTFIDLAGESAIDDAGREEAVADVILADCDAQDIEVELLDGFGESDGRMLVDENSERGKDFAEFLVLFNLDEIASFAGVHLLKVVVCESGNFF